MRTLLVVLCLAWLGGAAHARTVSYAVVIGNNAPPADSQLPRLRYADDDAVRYYDLLSQFARTTLLSTLDDETQKRHVKVAALARVPSLDTLRQVFGALGNDMRLDREAGNDPVLYLVFSGHGAIAGSGEAFLVLTDGPLTQRILFDELIGSLPTPRTHVIIDACHAAGVVGVRGGSFFDKESDGKTAAVTDSEAIAITRDKVLERYPNVGVITATTLGSETHEWSDIEAGVFSYEVLSGLAGPADVNGDHNIEYSELQAFVANANRSISNPRAVPMMVSEPPHADRRSPIVRLGDLRQSYLLRGKVGEWGHFSIALEDGQRLLDANMSNEREVTVALPVGASVFVRTPKGEAKVTSRGKAVAVGDLVLAQTTVAARGGIDADYRDNLFASAYGPTYYRGFADSHGSVPVDFTINLQVSGELQPERPVDDRDAGRWRRRGGYVLAGTTVIFTAVAVVAGLAALDARRGFNSARTQDEARGDAANYRETATAFWTFTALSAVSGLGSRHLFKSARHMRLTPMPTAGGPPGLSLSGDL